jgi:hypothetical protein
MTANHQTGIGVFLSKPDGSFNPVKLYLTQLGFDTRASIEDINGDGHLDIILLGNIGFSGDHQLLAFLGQGQGNFVSGLSLAVPLSPTPFVVADLTGDGKIAWVGIDNPTNCRRRTPSAGA